MNAKLFQIRLLKRKKGRFGLWSLYFLFSEVEVYSVNKFNACESGLPNDNTQINKLFLIDAKLLVSFNTLNGNGDVPSRVTHCVQCRDNIQLCITLFS